MDVPKAWTDLENGQLAELGYAVGLIDLAAIRRWADSLIEREAEPAPWMIDLALVTKESAWDLLHRFLLEKTSRKVLRTVSGMIARKWNAGELTKQQLIQVGYEVFQRSDHWHEAVWGCCIADMHEGIAGGWMTEDQFHDYCNEQLAPFLQDKLLIPAWLPEPQ